MIRAAIVIAVLACGCSVGFGSAYVGQWRHHHEVEFDSCRVDERGTCLEHKQVTSNIPARRFWGVDIAFPSTGAAVVSRGGMTEARLRLDPWLEILRGRGAAAIGVRLGVSTDVPTAKGNAIDGVVSFPIDIVGHLSLGDRFGIYGGAGYVPYAKAIDYTSLGGRALAGVQFALGHDLLERWILLSVEGSYTYLHLDPVYHSTAVTANLGLYF